MEARVTTATCIVRFDLRSPTFGAPTHELYGAFLEMAAFAEQHDFTAVVVSEHHACDDGYLPSPLVAAAAAAARTSRIAINVAALLLPLYDPVKLAEDMAVLDHISQGRVSYVVGIGYAGGVRSPGARLPYACADRGAARCLASTRVVG
jgi:alkanesulfonate monooxygenase SsuD/methylene tetrahydromethanopterin reductase-like flavin-dependent oxidoreductase (luciferase family)